MKVTVDNVDLFQLSETQKQVIQDNVPSEIFDEDMKRRLQWIITHKYEECHKELQQKWYDILVQRGVTMMPTDPDTFAQLVFSQPDYKSRSARDAQALAAEQQSLTDGK